MTQSRTPLALAALVAAVGCSPTGDDSTSPGAPTGSATTPSNSAPLPPQGPADPGLRDLLVFEDPNADGDASEVRLQRVEIARLVDLYALDGAGNRVLMGRDFPIEPDLTSNGTDYLYETTPVLTRDVLVILRNVETPSGQVEFRRLLREAFDNLRRVQDLDLNAPLFSMVPRNGALLLRFDDLLDAGTVSPASVRLVVGDPPLVPFEGSVFASPYFGDRGPDGLVAPTRVVLDLATSEIEAIGANPPLPVNNEGLPAGLGVGIPNGQLRLPTESVLGFPILTNLAGSSLAFVGNGPNDPVDPARPITRAFRSGAPPEVAADPFQGFLRDEQPPSIVGETPIDLPMAPEQLGGPRSRVFRIPRIDFVAPACASAPRRGAVLAQPAIAAEVLEDAPLVGGTSAFDVLVELIVDPFGPAGPGTWEVVGAGPGGYQRAYDPTLDAGQEACFLRATPTPAGAPGRPTTGVSPASTFTLTFSEPMDRRRGGGLESLALAREPRTPNGTLPPPSVIVGETLQAADLKRSTLVPFLPLTHRSGTAESYFVSAATQGSANEQSDLAGNFLVPFPEIELTLDPGAPEERTGGRLTGFESTDEEPPFGGRPEWGGQLLFDLLQEVVRARPVIRSSVVIDGTQAIVAQMTPFPPGTSTVFNTYGAKLQTIWRYADMGFALTDPQTINVDVEGLAWSPSGGNVVFDSISEFQIGLAHSFFAPDEVIDPASLFPRFGNSGLGGAFAPNVIAPDNTDVVHQRSDGFTVDPADTFLSPTGTVLAPFPLNRGLDPDEFRTKTWRDTSIRSRGGPGSAGVEPQAYLLALGMIPPAVSYFRPGQVQTIGLPLLMDFRTYPQAPLGALNAWTTALATNSSSRPYFRAFSAGGVDQAGSTVLVDPDAETMANGGFNPGSTPPGAPTFGRDNSVSIGAADLVVRVSRAYSVWFESTIPGFPALVSRDYLEPVVAPAASRQPDGTEVEVELRGATSIVYANTGVPISDNDQDDNGIVDYTENAFTLDLYGDFYNEVDGPLNHDTFLMNPLLTFAGGTDAWQASADDIDDARYYQVRLTFRSNIASGATPNVSALGVAWSEN
ncbi:MAG: hypothetical protein AAF957_05985 [Planctomycetota bacterium]